MSAIKSLERLGVEMDAGAGANDYATSLTFTSSKFIVIAFGHNDDHAEDVLQCVLLGKFSDAAGDREMETFEDKKKTRPMSADRIGVLTRVQPDTPAEPERCIHGEYITRCPLHGGRP